MPKVVFLLVWAAYAGGSWVKVASESSPMWRYSHNMAFYDDNTVIATHGYNNRDPATMKSKPDWRDDTWMLAAGVRNSPWHLARPSDGQKAKPSARYGSSTFRLGDSLYLFGGDDGAHNQGSGSYVWGSYLNDVWRLHREGDEWAWTELHAINSEKPQHMPAHRSLHACTTVPFTQLVGDIRENGDGSRVSTLEVVEAGFCFGGLTANLQPKTQQNSDENPLIDSHQAWMMRLRPSSEGLQAVWSELHWENQELPHARHGHSLIYTSRAIVFSHIKGNFLEHNLIIFGGSAMACDTRLLAAQGLRENTDFLTYRRRLRAVAPGEPPVASVSCQFGDLWRAVWTSQLGAAGLAEGERTVEEEEAGAGLGEGWTGSGSAGLHYVPRYRHAEDERDGELLQSIKAARWELVKPARRRGRFGPGELYWRIWLASSQLYLLDGIYKAQRPSPRSMASLTAVSNGIMLFGGGLCTPGCTCYGDTWLLAMPPAVMIHDTNTTTVPLHADWVKLTNRHHRITMKGAADISNEVGGAARMARWLTMAADRNSTVNTVVDIGWHEPPARYRHAAVSDYRQVLCATLHYFEADFDNGVSPQVHFNEDCGEFTTILFGGESYMPSQYFDDTWIWVHDDALYDSQYRPLPDDTSAATAEQKRPHPHAAVSIHELFESQDAPAGLMTQFLTVLCVTCLAICVILGGRLKSYTRMRPLGAPSMHRKKHLG